MSIEKIPLGDVSTLVRGPFGGSLKKSIFVDDGYAVYEQSHAINDQFSEIRYFIDENKYKEMQRFTVEAGDLIMSCSGTMGKVAIVPENVKRGIINQALLLIKPEKKLLNTYLKYYMVSPQFENELSKHTKGVAIKNVASVKILKSLLIPLPENNEQKRIVSVLDKAFADLKKSSEYSRMNVMHSHELYSSYTSSLFSSRDSTWTTGTVKDMIDNGIIEKIQDGNHGEIHPKKSEFASKGIPFLMAADLKDYKVDLENCNFIQDKQAKNLRVGFARNGDVLLTHKGTVGRVAVLSTVQDYVVLTPQVTYYRVKDKTRLLNKYLMFYFESSPFQQELVTLAKAGSTRAYVGITKQLSLPVAFPPIDIQEKIVEKLEQMSLKTKRLADIYNKEETAINELKKSILNKAFSGEL